ncbi:MAG TPA: tetratricopeptide repeat protein [Pelovirga sp.]|nr:tetratricopeptide repeat protein [Pelovirga sp.]
MLDPGQQIADCKVIRQLAQYDSRLEYLVTTVAGEQKLVQFSGSPNWSRAQRQAFHDQIKALCALDIYAVGAPLRMIEQKNELFCLYPLPPGEPLQNILIDERSVRSALEMIHALAKLLEPAHQQQLFHGALSPYSVNLDKNQPFLADFALASLVVFDYHTAVETEYASPEQIRGEPPGTAADVYSLGCLFYALLMGRPPFLGADAFTVGMQHLNDSFPDLPEGLAFCAELLAKMTVKSASERLSIVEVRAHCEELLSLDVLDQIPNRVDSPPAAADEELRIQQDTMAMVARIEDQLRDIEEKAADTATTQKPTDEEVSLSPPATPGTNVTSPRRFLSLLVGLIIGFCLGALFFDFFLVRPDGAPSPTVFTVETVDPDYTNSIQLWLEGDLQGAERELKKLLANFPDHPQIHNNLAAVAAVRGDIEAARVWLEQAMALDAQTATIYQNLGSVYAELARDSYGRALQFDYEQIPLQLDIFTNQGVASSPSGSVTVIAEVDPAADEGDAARDEAEFSVPLSAASRSDESGAMIPNIAQAPAGADSVNAQPAEPPVVLNQESEDGSNATVEPQQDPLAEQVAPAVAATAAAVPAPEDPLQFLERWAAAWSAQEVEEYLAFYSDDFVPSGGLNYDEWESQRRERLQRPEEILVTLRDVDIRREADDFLQLEVVQEYRSERYSDLTRKLFDLRHQDGSWKIERERSLELIYR